MTGEPKLLTGPPLAWTTCPMCAGRGHVTITAYRVARSYPTCRGAGKKIIDNRFASMIDRRAYELGLEPRP